MPSRVTLPKRRAQETRQCILDAAYHVLAREGYGEATVEDILVEAGISRGAFYHHFTGKEELFRAHLHAHTHRFGQVMGAISAASSLQEMVERIVAVWLDHYRTDKHSLPLSLEFRLLATREAWAREILVGFQREIRGHIAGLLRSAQARGVIGIDLNVEDTAILLFGLLDGVCIEWGVDPEGVDLHRLRQPLADLVTEFIAGQRPANDEAAKR